MSDPRIPVGYNWIMANVSHQGDDCLLWPFCVSTPGYGQFMHEKKHYLAHRYMCRLVNGDPPTPRAQAAHSCGNRRCCNPKHLSWKSPAGNQLDRTAHGTRTKKIRKLNIRQAQQIRALKGVETSVETAARYGVTESNVRLIQDGKTWQPTLINYWSAQEVAKMEECIGLGQNFSQIAAALGRPKGAVSACAYRLGLKSGWAPGGTGPRS